MHPFPNLGAQVDLGQEHRRAGGSPEHPWLRSKGLTRLPPGAAPQQLLKSGERRSPLQGRSPRQAGPIAARARAGGRSSPAHAAVPFLRLVGELTQSRRSRQSRKFYWVLVGSGFPSPSSRGHVQCPLLGARSCPIMSANMRLHSAAYGLSSTSWRRANWLPNRAACSKSLRASSSRPCKRAKSPRCTKLWRAARPRPPLSVTARSKSSRAPAGRRGDGAGQRSAASEPQPTRRTAQPLHSQLAFV